MHTQTKLDLAAHFSVAVICSAALFFKFHSLAYAAVFAAGSIFIDLDHFIDYFLYRNKFSLSHFVNSAYLKSGKSYIFLHSWELVIILALIAGLTGSALLTVFSLSLVIHLCIDNVQRRRPLFYFLIYRMINKFDARFLVPEHFELKRQPPGKNPECANERE